MELIRLLRTTAFRLFLIYFALFAITAGLAVAYIYWQTNALLGLQLETAIRAELQSLDEQYRAGGLDQLRRTIAERSETPGNSLYLLTDAEGHRLAGTLKAVSSDLWNSSGSVIFVYRRPAPGGTEERLAYAVAFRLKDSSRLIVGRDIEDRREFGRVVRSAFLWSLAAMTLIGIGGGLLIGRSLLRRIEAVTETSRQIMSGDLSRRIPVGSSGDEFDRLASSLNAMLQRIGELVDGFKEVSDNIAHDLKTPLTRLRNRIETALRDTPGQDAYREALQASIEEADDIIKTFDALLSIARLEAAAPGGARGELDLNAIVSGVCDLYEPVAEERGLKLSCRPAPAARIRGEPQLIAQAVANLLDNAIKYGGRPGQDRFAEPGIFVSVALNGENAQITVADHGPGIPEPDRERVLKRFVRLEASRSRPGSGLGLSLAAAVARIHGGNVTLLDNEPGVKAVLTLRRDGAAPTARAS